MSSYRVHVADQRQGTLTGHDGERYASPPHAEPEAFTLARLLLGIVELPDRHGPWQQAIPGGRRVVWLEQASEPLTGSTHGHHRAEAEPAPERHSDGRASELLR